MPKTKGPRKYVSEFKLQVGPISMTGSLTNVVATSNEKAGTFFSVCPACDPPTRVKQQYVCENNHGPFVAGDLTVKGKEVDGVIVTVEKDELTAARTSELTLNTFRPTIHPRDQVEASTFVGDKSYVFTPNSVDEYFGLVTQMIADPENAFVGLCNVRNNEGFYRLQLWNGNIVLQKLLWPEDLNEFSSVEVNVSEDLQEAAGAMVERIKTDFDPSEYRSSIRERIRAINAALGVEDGVSAAKVSIPVKKEVDILSALESFGS